MSIDIANLTAGIGTTNSQNTASIAATTGGLLLLTVGVSVDIGGTVPDDIIVTGLGGTWEKIGTALYGARRRAWLFQGTGCTGSGVINLDFSPLDPPFFQEFGWVIDEATGQDGTTPTASAVASSGQATSRTVTTGGTPAAGDATYSSLCLESNIDAAVEGGWTALGQTTTGSLGVRRVESAWDDAADVSHAWTWDGSDQTSAAFLVIVKVGEAPVSDDGLLNPITDVSNAGSWTTDTGATSGLYTAIDEDSNLDSDFIQSPVGPSSAVYEVALEDVVDPGVNTDHIVRYRYGKSVAADTVDLTVGLYQGATLIEQWVHTDISASLTSASPTLSGADADSIVATDGFYTDLRLRFTANMTAGGGTPALVADRDTENSNSGVITVDLVLTGLTVGNVLVIRTSADNSGGGGSARSCTPSNQSGSAMGTVFGNYQRNYDPGAASAGTTCNVIVAPITATSGTVRLTYGGSVVQAAVAEEWSGVDPVEPVVGTPVGNDGAGSTNLASLTDASVADGNCAYGVEAVEGPSTDTYTQDADTTNGSWTGLTKVGTTNGTADTNQTTYGGYKVVSAAGGQTYNPTIAPARDSTGLILEFAKAPPTARAKVTWAQFEVPFSNPLAETVTDDFDDNDLDHDKWFVTPTYVAETGQVLQITPTAGYPSIYSAATVALTGSHVFAKVPTVPNVGNGTTSAGLFFHVDTNNRVGVLWTADGLKMFERLVGSDTWLASVTYNSTTHLWWRLRAIGTTVYWDTSPDGTTWTNRHSKDYSAAPSMDLEAGVIYLEAGFYGTEPSPGVAEFDNLNVAPTSSLEARRVMAKTAGGLVEINVRAWTGAAAVSSTARSG